MPKVISTSALEHRQLLLQPVSHEDYGVEIEASDHGRLSIGRIMRVSRSLGRDGWFWMITGAIAPPSGLVLSGEAETFEGATSALRTSFDALVFWAGLRQGGELTWQVADAAGEGQQPLHYPDPSAQPDRSGAQ